MNNEKRVHHGLVWNRRKILKLLLASATAPWFPLIKVSAQNPIMLHRPIPSSGEKLPVIGLGTSRVFDVGSSPAARAPLIEVLTALIDRGGSVIDTSPMYGHAEQVTGELVSEMRLRKKLFFATKVWTEGRDAGITQLNHSFTLLQSDIIDLMQVHNLIDTNTHLSTISSMKENGRIRYSGVTHYQTEAHKALERVIASTNIDFVQFNYSIVTRDAEDTLLPLAAERGVAVIINRPYESGKLFQLARRHDLPVWAKEFDCASWGQFFLKFIVSHPAITCVIPGTSKASHALDNLSAGYGQIPDATARKRMVDFVRDW